MGDAVVKLVQLILEFFNAWRRKLAIGAVAMVALYVGYFVMFGTNGVLAYQKKKVELEKLKKEVQELQAENTDRQKRIAALKSDPKAIEKEAREQLRYAKPGEVIYVMPTPKPQEPQTGFAKK